MFPRGRSIDRLQNFRDQSPGLVSLKDMQYRVKNSYIDQGGTLRDDWLKNYRRTDYTGSLKIAFDGRTNGVVHSGNTTQIRIRKPIFVPSNVFPAMNSALDFNLAAQLTDPAWMPVPVGTFHDHVFYDTVSSYTDGAPAIIILLLYPTSFAAGTICSMGQYFPAGGPYLAPANILLANTPSPGQISLSCRTGGVVVPNYMVTTAVLQLNKPQVVAFVRLTNTWEIWHEGVRIALTTTPPSAVDGGRVAVGHTSVQVGGTASILTQSNFFSGLVGGVTIISGTMADLSSVTANSCFFYKG